MRFPRLQPRRRRSSCVVPRRSPISSRRRERWGSAAPTWTARWRWTISTERSWWSTNGSRRSWRSPIACAWDWRWWPRRHRAGCHVARDRAGPPRAAAQRRARRGGGPLPLRRRQRVLCAVPGRVDDVQLRDLLAGREHAGGGTAHETGAGGGQARPRAGDAGAGRGLRVGELRDPRRSRVRGRGGGHHAVRAPGRTRTRALAQAGMADRVEIRVQDYRRLAHASFDAISSIGMSEHVGDSQIDVYAKTLFDILKPGGTLLNHAIAALDPGAEPLEDLFSTRYVFPDGEPLPLSRVQLALERAGFSHGARGGLSRGLRRDAAPLGAKAGRAHRRGRAAGWRGAHARVAPVPARSGPWLHDWAHGGLPGAKRGGPSELRCCVSRTSRARGG